MSARKRVALACPVADRLTEIEARANAATDAPWVHREHETGVWMGEWFGLICRTDTGNRARPDDAAFIAHARDDIPWLLARVRELEQESADERTAHEAMGERLATELERVRELEAALREIESMNYSILGDVSRVVADMKNIARAALASRDVQQNTPVDGPAEEQE